jgi:SAM-dependent methyltransferase
MMFGSRQSFEYRECDECGSVWLAPDMTPAELGEYYGPNYYSYGARKDNFLHHWVLGEWSPVGRIMASRRPNTTVRMIGTLGLAKTARILDVGCGGGRLLDRLKGIGFTQLMGVDPFIDEDQVSPAGVPIRKGYLADLSERFDLVMFHHSLEHTVDPIDDLAAARVHLAPGGRCLVRIPTVSSYAWEHYGVDWVQLDAPRHTAIPSRAGMARAVTLAGFRLADTIDDSTPFQFEGSERYRADVPLLDHDFPIDPTDRARFVRDSERLNAQGRGDQVGFVLAL